jgi:hypothetical protein
MSYAKLKVAELKELLQERGLPTSGKKAELVARLEEADDTNGAQGTQEQVEDEFAELYGAPAPESEAPAIDEKPTIEGIRDDQGDDDLFLALYGEVKPEEQEAAKSAEARKEVVLEAPELDEDVARALEEDAAVKGGHDKDGLGDESEGSEEDEDSSDDDLMINLDANATDYEPSQIKFQKSAAFAAQPVSHIPGLGEATARTAIGGIPRSAIPGMAFQSAAPPPPRDPRQAPGAVLSPSDPRTGPSDPRDPRAAPADPRDPRAAPADPRDPRMAGAPSGGHAPRQFNMADAVFPSEWKPGLPCKLPGQTRVSPEEYKEFLTLGHGEIFSIDLDSVIDPPWMLPGTDPSDFFNYGMSMTDWKNYQERVKQYRLEFTMRGQIQTFDQSDGLTNIIFAQKQLTDGKDQSLQASMLDADAANDATYEAFVTSERPERTTWQRHGNPWDHTIVLTGFELDFGEDDQRRSRFNSRVTGVRPPFVAPGGPGRPGGPGFSGPPFGGGFRAHERGRGRGRGRGRFGDDGYNGFEDRKGPKLGLGIGMDEEENGGGGYRGGFGGRGRGYGGRGRGGRFGGVHDDRRDACNEPFVNRPRDGRDDRDERRYRSRSRSPSRRRDDRDWRDDRTDKREYRSERNEGDRSGGSGRGEDWSRSDRDRDRGRRDEDRRDYRRRDHRDRRRRSRSRSPPRYPHDRRRR